MVKKVKLFCTYCGQKIVNSGALVSHCRTHKELYEFKMAGKIIFERKDRLVQAISCAGGWARLRLFDDLEDAYNYTTLKQVYDPEVVPLCKPALYALIQERLFKGSR